MGKDAMRGRGEGEGEGFGRTEAIERGLKWMAELWCEDFAN
jgi:hypothetical protein